MTTNPTNSRMQGEGRVAVVGAGAAGMAAAISAARAGAAVTLIDQRPAVGGTVAHALIHTIGGLYDDDGEYLNDGLVVELCERLAAAGDTRRRRIGKTSVLNVCPGVYGSVVDEWLRTEPGLSLLTGTRLSGVKHTGGRVTALALANTDRAYSLPVDQVIDASGSAALVRAIDPSLAYDDPDGAAGGLIFRLRGVIPGSFAFPTSAKILRRLRRAATDGTLPAECSHAWLDEGVADDEVYVKLFVPMRSALASLTSDELAGRLQQSQDAIVAILKNHDGFADAQVDCVGEIGVRDGGRIHGDYCLTEEDVRCGRTFDDGVARCNWPIEYWDGDAGVRLEYLPEGGSYEVPLRSLKVRDTDNVWAAGKCLSADRHAQASARIAGACWAMGEAVGRVAAERAAAGHLTAPRVGASDPVPLETASGGA